MAKSSVDGWLLALRSMLKKSADQKTKQWFEGYLKHVLPFYGVKMGGIRTSVHSWVKEKGLDQLSGGEQLNLAAALLRQTMAEEKLAGILFLQEVVIKSEKIEWKKVLNVLSKLYEDGFIFDWNTSDWVCTKVLDSLIRHHGEPCAHAVAAWSQSANLWRRRAAGVAFAWMAEGGDEGNFDGFIDLVLEVCSQTIRCQERFAQTGTGWVLRELAVADRDRVVQFVRDHASEFTAEGIDYTTEKMPESLKKQLKALVREPSTKEVGAKKKIKRT